MSQQTISATSLRTKGLFSTQHAAQGFSRQNVLGATDTSLPSPNSHSPIGNRGSVPPAEENSSPSQQSNVLCNSYDIEYAINKRYRYNYGCHKNLKTLQQTIGEKKRPCLFDAARIFGGSECSAEVFNGICSFHWSMMNIRIGICEQYNTNKKTDGTFQHYEMLVDVPIPDRALIPIFPNVTHQTTMFDLMFGFSYATNRGLMTTRINEGAAMAYALYYMLDNHCYVEFLARSTYWIQNMTEYLMAFPFYNDEMAKEVFASRLPVEQNGVGEPRSVLKSIFTKNIYIQDLQFNVDRPKIELPPGIVETLSQKDTRLVRDMPPLSGSGNQDASSAADVLPAAPRVHRSMSYKKFHIFTAPLVLSLRPSSYVTDIFVYGAPPVVGVFNISFKDTREQDGSEHSSAGHSVFAIQGPIQYGVAMSRGSRNLPFCNDMPVCTQAYVATLGSVSNVDVNEDRIFAGELARFADFTIKDNDQVFHLNNLR